MIASLSDQVCPTCGKLLATSQLAQLNATLEQLVNAKGIHCDMKTPMIQKIVAEIERVSQHISKCEGIVHFPENTTGNPA